MLKQDSEASDGMPAIKIDTTITATLMGSPIQH